MYAFRRGILAREGIMFPDALSPRKVWQILKLKKDAKSEIA